MNQLASSVTAERYLIQADPQAAFLEELKAAYERLKGERDFRASARQAACRFTHLLKKASHAQRYARVRRPNAAPPVASGLPYEVMTLLAVGYMNSMESLRVDAARGPAVINNCGYRLGKLDHAFKGVDDDFMDELLIKTEARAAVEPAYAAKLEAAMAEVVSLAGPFGELGTLDMHFLEGPVDITIDGNVLAQDVPLWVVLVSVVVCVSKKWAYSPRGLL
jgi:hypothetical protein